MQRVNTYRAQNAPIMQQQGGIRKISATHTKTPYLCEGVYAEKTSETEGTMKLCQFD